MTLGNPISDSPSTTVFLTSFSARRLRPPKNENKPIVQENNKRHFTPWSNGLILFEETARGITNSKQKSAIEFRPRRNYVCNQGADI